MKNILLSTIILFQFISCKPPSASPEGFTQNIPVGENSWISRNKQEDGKIIKKEGIRNWSGSQPIHTYFWTNKKGKINLGLDLERAPKGAELRISLAGKNRKVKLDKKNGIIYAGEFLIENPGYQKATLEYINPKKVGNIEINELLLSGPATKGELNFVKNNFHFGRRGPSVHLRYPIPEEIKKPQYFYSELVVPKGNDVIGSYFMANGFAHGYFGIQVNSADERRILFSVWSPFDTQDPSKIPEDQKIILLKKGKDVHVGEFGNEGSGGQSYKKYMWKSDTTYRFLLKGEPTERNHTDYTAYFYSPEKGKWELIASFRRPHTHTYLSNLYSFLENFAPDQGDIVRKAQYKNQWIYDEDQGWNELTKAVFTADATANRKDRLDFAGGEINNGYYLQNCGFFNNHTPVNSKFRREMNGDSPVIDLKSLGN